jgi:hypothetical protein
MALFMLPFSIFPKSVAKTKGKFSPRQVWITPGNTCQCQDGKQEANQINCGSNTMQMTVQGDDY